MRLSERTCGSLPPEVERSTYDRTTNAVGIVHFGIGAFHRAHQAWFTDLAMEAGDRDWMTVGVSLRSDTVAREMNPQDCLYTVTERSASGAASRLIRCVRDVHVAGQDNTEIASMLANPATRIVSFTVTEKGYCRAPDGSVDLALAESASFYPFIAEAMRQRRAEGLAGLTFLSCDNLSENGRQLARLVSEYLDAHAPDQLGWFEAECRCPSTMVDRIVPASTDADRAELATRIGMEDEAAVFTEPFIQWVIEDDFAGDSPDWAAVGAQLTCDVAPFETAKLRILNGAHSALAYLGLERGHSFVHEAVADPEIRRVVEQLMRCEAIPTIAPAPGQDLNTYANDLLSRFENPALEHRLSQIAMDGSQKIPQRWLATLAGNLQVGRESPAILQGLAAWLRHARGDNGPVDDPLAPALADLWQSAGETGIVEAVFGASGPLAMDHDVPNIPLAI